MWNLKHSLLILSLIAALGACKVDISAEPDEIVADTTAPTISITAPSSSGSYTTDQQIVSVSGEAGDNIGLHEVTWNDGNGKSGTAQGSTSWSTGGISLIEGSNTITVTARDASGNEASDVISIEYKPSGDGGSGGGDQKAPIVQSTSPADGGSAGPATSVISVNFDEPIYPASVTQSTIELLGPTGTIPFTVEVANAVISIKPDSTLSVGDAFTATVAGTVSDLAGNKLGSDYSWTFTVADDVCAGHYASNFALVQGFSTTKPGNLAKPAKGVPYSDPAYGSCVVRATDHEVEAPNGFARNDYSRRQPFNADESKFLIYAQDGYWHLYNAHDMTYIRKLNLGGGSTEPQWHPTNPDLLYIFPNNGGLTISTYNVLTDATRVVADFRSVSGIVGLPLATSVQTIWPTAARIWTKSEGSPSADARYWGLMVETNDFKPLGMITYDLQTDTITGFFDFLTDGGGIGRPDHISMSPSGKYIVPSWNGSGVNCDSGLLGTLNDPCGLMAYSRDFTSAVGLAVRGPHSDIAIDASGNDVIVISNYATGYVEMYSLATGAVTNLWPIYIDGASTAMHVSGKNYAKPGWVLVSTYAEKNPNGVDLWYARKIMAVELKKDPRILNIAHTYSLTNSYFSEPHAAVNRDFTKIVFNSNWGTGLDTDIDAYMISLPAGAVPAN